MIKGKRLVMHFRVVLPFRAFFAYNTAFFFLQYPSPLCWPLPSPAPTSVPCGPIWFAARNPPGQRPYSGRWPWILKIPKVIKDRTGDMPPHTATFVIFILPTTLQPTAETCAVANSRPRAHGSRKSRSRSAVVQMLHNSSLYPVIPMCNRYTLSRA